MLGIIDFATYIPYYRLPRPALGEAWQLEPLMPLLIGESAIAGYDEDTITMGVESAEIALHSHDRQAIEAVYFATTTPPFSEKSSAAVIAAACDLGARRSLDVTGSLRAGTSALGLAFDGLRAGAMQHALVVAADNRRPEPGTLLDALSGAGAAAFVVGAGDEVVAELVGSYHLSDPTLDTWQRPGDSYLRTDDEAFTNQVGYTDLTRRAIQGLLETTGIKPSAIKGVALYTPEGRVYMSFAKKSPLGMAFMQMGAGGPAPYLLMHAGNLGAAFAPAQLALLLESAEPDSLIALIGYGDGADAFLFRVTEAIRRRAPRRRTADWIQPKGTLSYTLVQQFRQNIVDKPIFPPEVDPWTSLPLLYRERQNLLNFYAQRCTRCGAVWYPNRPNCFDCGAQDGFDYFRLSGQGTVASFVAEWAIPTPLPPVGMVTVDTPEGARITIPSTDGDPRRTLAVDQPVEFALRIFHTAKGLPHYGWKVRQVRG